jgi:hypothetical protein
MANRYVVLSRRDPQERQGSYVFVVSGDKAKAASEGASAENIRWNSTVSHWSRNVLNESLPYPKEVVDLFRWMALPVAFEW